MPSNPVWVPLTSFLPDRFPCNTLYYHVGHGSVNITLPVENGHGNGCIKYLIDAILTYTRFFKPLYRCVLRMA